MNLPVLPLIDGCLFIDNSHWIEPMMTCETYLGFVSLNQRISVGEKAALNFGTAQHIHLEYRYKQQWDEQIVSSLLSEFFEKHPVSEDEFRNLNWAWEIAKQYHEKYKVEQFTLLRYLDPRVCDHCQGGGKTLKEINGILTPTDDICVWCKGTGKDTLIVEMPFAVKFMDWVGWLSPNQLPLDFPENRILEKDSFGRVKVRITVFYSGKIDVPVILDGGLWIMDHKTNKELGNWFFDDMQRSSQQRGYVWAFGEVTGQMPIGYIANGIRTKEPPRYVKEGKEYRGKSKSISEWWNESLRRERYYVRPDEVLEWKKNTMELVEKFFWQYSRDYLPINTKSCTRYNRCQYWEVCTTALESRGAMLRSGLFTDNKWSPLIKSEPIKHENVFTPVPKTPGT